MEKILNYIKINWILLSIGILFLGSFVYLTFSGNKFCDCVKTEKYKDGKSSSSRGHSSYRFYHK
ncbi:hypothetical protein HZP84_14905 [Elizabethkingia anophelis]|uniref:Uncharacterized protein n=3 Tax=Elizabethkingia TaxID=308865 RepID=A0A7Z7LVZ3_9FLAO|nr:MULTISPECIES: hypothetical protein [Elizabethkingia]ATC36426.1 hypothetical protein BAZ09_009485 [Elizabethkingia anophelis R26]ATC40103.1 hypothetical protein EAAG1_009700 [Elizabethkingia anophelis Ag1]ATC43781.1 hypothetical protein CMV41_09700 [Elizabethkingia anophelis]ATC47457.1 hypothetical protein CMV40_09700 [Elizabethkingia anophelis]EJC8059229.1 hypothetical protein [Elizabethkingia anophelis]